MATKKTLVFDKHDLTSENNDDENKNYKKMLADIKDVLEDQE